MKQYYKRTVYFNGEVELPEGAIILRFIECVQVFYPEGNKLQDCIVYLEPEK